MSETIEVGERLPNFSRRDQHQQPITFYQNFCGRPVVLAITRDWRADAHILTRLRSVDGEWDLVVMVTGAVVAQEAAAELPPDICQLVDDGAVSEFLAGKGRQLSILALDANLRVLDIFGADLDPDSLRALYRGETAGEKRRLSGQAPALIIPRVFEPEFCRRLIEAYHEQNEPSGVLAMAGGEMVYREDPGTKIRREHRLAQGALLAAVEGRIQRRVLPEIQWCFNFAVTSYEGVKVVLYDATAGGYFGAHRDNDGEDTAHRRFAMTVNLNRDDYEGGELRFPEYGDYRYAPPSGAAIVFSCNLAHEALPVTRGQRFALVSFFFGQGDRLKRAEYDNQVAGSTPAAPKTPRWS